MTENALSPSVVLPGQGTVLRAFGDEITLLLTGKETGGKYTMFLGVTPPGGGPPPHVHGCEDEWFHVLEGRASFLKDGQWMEVPVGTTVFMPKGTVHTFKNVGNTPLKQIVHTSPSGFERFFSRCADEFVSEAGPNMDRIMQICADHGIRFVQS